jgi:cell division protease FtsH
VHLASSLDPALVRRFSRLILVDLPDTAARRRYLTLRLKEGDPKVIDLIAEKSVGASISDLERIIDSARRAAFERGVPVSAEMALESLDTANEGEARPWSPQFLESTARHEAGHTILYWLSGWWAPEVSIIARGNHGGGMRRAEAEMKRESLTREDLLANIRTCLGGRAAEILHSGSGGLTTGASGDMEQATRLARQMICRYGMNDAFGLLSAPELLSHPEALGSPLYARVCEAAASILDGEMKRSLELLAEHRDKLDRLAASLCERNRLYRSDLEQLLPAPPAGPLS